MSVILRAIGFAGLFIGIVLVALPYSMISREIRAPVPIPLRALGLLLAAVGASVVLSCLRDFVVRGRGTPAPWDPPRRLVVAGLYRYVRNPMYVGALALLAGEGILFGSRNVLLYTGFFWIATHLFVLIYEEPHLERAFEGEYEEYRSAVPRWLPRLRPWTPRETS